jgi:hypothetical protein
VRETVEVRRTNAASAIEGGVHELEKKNVNPVEGEKKVKPAESAAASVGEVIKPLSCWCFPQCVH